MIIEHPEVDWVLVVDENLRLGEELEKYRRRIADGYLKIVINNVVRMGLNPLANGFGSFSVHGVKCMLGHTHKN